MYRSTLASIIGLAGTVGLAAFLFAQTPEYMIGGRVVQGVMPPERSGFTFCRLVYHRTYAEASGSGWNTDYPDADQNFMVRLSELTHTPITWRGEGNPAHAIVAATDDALFQCPFLYTSDAGTIGWSDYEVERMREFFDKGGVFWVDDFWGDLAWNRWSEQIGRVLPEYAIQEIPMDHPLFGAFYFVPRIPQIPSIQFWRRSGGETSERGAETAKPTFAGIFDDKGRLLVAITHNTDIADAWEREAEDIGFFNAFSPYGYAIGINVAIWSMTH
ncbi:MAG: DUF4159 domain-containing protein [Gemmatimonadota bacterium]|jgi:hypothetical protein|nr:DUF4159 domain-containing protein [Gemmatimonadota bacterium]